MGGPLALLQMEVVQRDYEGHRVPEDLKERVAALDDERDAMNFEAVDTLYRALDKLPNDPDFTYVQPNALEGIRRERPEGPRQLGTAADADLLDRFHTAWTGRAAGCALRKPVEGMGIRGQQGMGGRQAIRTYLENGAANGSRALDSSLVAPLNDTIKPKVIGFPEVSMTELAERTLKVHQRVVANA